MKKLGKTEVQEFNEILNVARESYEEINSAIEKYNQSCEELWEAIEAAKEKYNTALDDALNFTDQVSNEMTDYFEERSEKWQESEKGDAYREWIDEWENISLDRCNIEQPEPIEEFDSDAIDLLEELNTEFDG